MESKFTTFSCDCCGAEYLFDRTDMSYEMLTPGSNIYDDELTIEPDLDEELEEDEVTAEPEPGSSVSDTAGTHTYAADHAEAYQRGAPVVLGTDVVKGDGSRVRVNQPVTNQAVWHHRRNHLRERQTTSNGSSWS